MKKLTFILIFALILSPFSQADETLPSYMKVEAKKDGDFDRIDDLVDAINEKDIDYLRSEIDIDNFIDYMVFESYIANEDWPSNNVRFHAIEDNKFRFVLFDLDVANQSHLNKSPPLFHLLRSTCPALSAYLYPAASSMKKSA